MYKNEPNYLIKYLKHWNRDIIKNNNIINKTTIEYFNNKSFSSLLRIDHKSWKNRDEENKKMLLKNFICNNNNDIIVFTDKIFYKEIYGRNAKMASDLNLNNYLNNYSQYILN